MEITLDPLEWTSDDVANFRAFLKTPTGSRLVPKLAESFPKILREGDTNAILIRTGEVAGMQDLIRALLMLSNSSNDVPVKTPEAYPDLNNDAAWNDNQTIQ